MIVLDFMPPVKYTYQMETTSKRPYLVRALNEWILDNNLTPHVVVDCTNAHVVVPRDYIKDNKIILNINPKAASKLELGKEYMTFDARFSGELHHITIPMDAIMGIYAKENGNGMIFTSSTESTSDDQVEQVEPENNCEHVWSDPSLAAGPIVCTICNVPKVRYEPGPGLSVVE